MAQLSTAGGLISTLAAPEPMRFSSTGAGAPHTSCRTGWEISTSAAIGASSRTHSRKPAMTSASDQVSRLGRLGGVCRLGWRRPTRSSSRLCPPARRSWVWPPARCLDGLARRTDGRGLVRRQARRLRLRRRLGSGPRPPRRELEGRPARRVLAKRNGLGRHHFDGDGGRLACRRAQRRDRAVVEEGQGSEAQDSSDRQLVDTVTTDRDSRFSIRATCVMLYSKNSQRPRVPRTMGGSCGRTMMGGVGEVRGDAPERS